MKMTLDDYATLDSPLHRWSPREKLLGLGGLIFAFSMVDRLDLVPAMLGTTAILFGLSRLPLSFLASRLKLPGVFLLSVALVLPFFPAKAADPASLRVLLELGPLAIYQSGVIGLIIIIARFLCILTLGLLLFGTAPFMATVRALRSLGLPPILADMILLTYRYLYEIGDSFRTLRTAMRLRGFRGHHLNRRTLAALVSLAGSLLVRSYEQSERVYDAMRLRGYGHGEAHQMYQQSRLRSPSSVHHWALGATLLISIAFVCFESFA